MRRHPRLWLTVSALAIALPACAADPAPPRAMGPPKRIPEVVEAPVRPAGDPVSTASMPRDVRRAVVMDAARRFRVPESSVVLTRAEQLTWSDGSLGCPEPGRFYTQMLVPGYRVVAKTTEGELAYNTDTRGNVVTCGAASPQPAKKLSDKVRRGVGPENAPDSPPRPIG